MQKTKRYRRRVREPGGTEHTSTRDDCSSGVKGEESSDGKEHDSDGYDCSTCLRPFYNIFL